MDILLHWPWIVNRFTRLNYRTACIVWSSYCYKIYFCIEKSVESGEGRMKAFHFFKPLIICTIFKKMHIKLLTFKELVLCYFKHPPAAYTPHKPTTEQVLICIFLLYPFPYYILTPNLSFPTFGSKDWK